MFPNLHWHKQGIIPLGVYYIIYINMQAISYDNWLQKFSVPVFKKKKKNAYR